MMRYLLLGALLFTACPNPDPKPTPTPSPTPVPECSCSLPADDSNWRATTVATPLGEASIRIARDAVGACGKDPVANLQALAAQMQSANVCAVQHGDALYVSRPDDVWEQWHPVQWVDGCWAALSGAYKGAWIIPGSQGCVRGGK